MSINRRDTTVNGHQTQLWGQGYDADARRVAAALPRGDVPGLRAIDADPAGTVLWYDRPEDTDHRRLTIPDGYRVVSIDHFDAGDIAVTVEPEGGA